MPAGNYTLVSTGNGYNCALRSDQRVLCWGADVGASPPDVTFSEVSAADGFACAVATASPWPGALWCWGRLTRQPAP